MATFQQTTCLPLLRSSYNGLTKSEQKLADYILKNPADVMHMTMSELADATSSADATVFRFCQKLGFSGFQGLKQALAGDLFSPAESLSQEVGPEDTPQEITRKVFQDMIDALQTTGKMLDYRALEQAMDIISRANRVDAYGYGGSGVVAQDIAHRFMRFGMDVHAYSDPHLQIASASLLKPEDVVIAISHTGASIDLLKVLEMARSRGSKIILITSYLKSPATKLADVVLTGMARETNYRSEAMASRLVHLAILDCLYTGVMLRRMDDYIDNMKQVRKAIAAQKM
ncbi:MAG: MurR/RpiR family transcriptional regulator [Acidaminococcaceae bacterium]|nr:MurR/RpiR family transcriptional regulator [Acidaminococcaceae bacterium]MBQ9257448.1 MurR/RpiR family transcriptional regulator [Acidaminococcaceae bacterium]MBQ9320143.1 MurR/RpiR family transcriptional regulator [Acidaminococcaceae bacterium]